MKARKPYLSVMLVATLLSACSPAPSPPINAQAPPQKTEVYPRSLSNSASVELGRALLSLMPGPQQDVGWDWGASTSIKWITSGFATNKDTSYTHRDGLQRINVMGQSSTILRQEKEELGWTVSLSTFDPPKFGPTQVELKPGLSESEGICFGTIFSGCAFDIEPSLSAANIAFAKICRSNDGASSFTDYYDIAAPGKKRLVLGYTYSSGSGGESSWVDIYFKRPNEMCE